MIPLIIDDAGPPHEFQRKSTEQFARSEQRGGGVGELAAMSACDAISGPKRWEILLVDDHPLVLDGLAKLIGQEPDLHICERAAEIGEAFQKIAAKEPDLVIVDLTLRGG